MPPPAMRLAFVAAAVSAAPWLVPPRDGVEAHSGDLGWIWVSNTASYEEVHDHTDTGAWQTAVGAAVEDWHDNTILDPHKVPEDEDADLHYFDDNYGDTGWLGAASVWSGRGTILCGSVEAGVTGNCNKTTTRANYAFFRLNDYYPQSDWQKRRTATHKLAHAFGLSHALCSDDAVMMKRSCEDRPNEVSPHDHWHIDQLY